MTADTTRKPLYVRLPTGTAETLDQVAFQRRMSKQDLVTDLVDALTVGSASFRAAPTDVLTIAEAAALLQVAEDAVTALAAAGDLPGREIGGEWRFSRAAVLRWLQRDA